ncbi:pyridoxal reductase, chloroplastic isoform X2 [Macadamia integrifolia]|uniref:pyridoxal reductase, chloroplastic isoform X2 n=1 Tax=Macadamia integrifolia TaxID=60698 RepID=UPI001C4E9EE0|nr:pyridoxal reductase, chloroplastic isoform X2 [Macadamia integrifolia]
MKLTEYKTLYTDSMVYGPILKCKESTNPVDEERKLSGMAFCTTTPTACLSRCSASEETLLPSPAFRALKIPRLRPPFWPWEKVKMGSLMVSPMGFGTWAWGNQLLWGYQKEMDDELQDVFNLAVENGINLFDTADSYGTGRLNGQSERLLGKFIRDFPGREGVRDGVVIATKFAAYPWRLTPGQFVKACQSSLGRLQIEKIGIGQLHWSTANYAPSQELALWDGLVAMYEKGLVRGVGVSNYGPKQLVKIHNYLKSRGVPLSSAQDDVS